MTTFSTRDRRVNRRPRRPFALGLESSHHALIHSWTDHGWAFDLVEDDLWHERPEGTARYALYAVAPTGGAILSYHDAAEDARLSARLMADPGLYLTPLPDEALATAAASFAPCDPTRAPRELADPAFVDPSIPAPISGGAPVEFVPRPRRRFEPTQADRVWWAQQHTPEPDWDTLYAESLRAGDVDPDASGAFVGHDA